MNQTRIEEDLLGSREVPVDAYYGTYTGVSSNGSGVSTASVTR